jgi:hypothetical protein
MREAADGRWDWFRGRHRRRLELANLRYMHTRTCTSAAAILDPGTLVLSFGCSARSNYSRTSLRGLLQARRRRRTGAGACASRVSLLSLLSCLSGAAALHLACACVCVSQGSALQLPELDYEETTTVGWLLARKRES